MAGFVVLVLLVGAERVAELVISTRNVARSLARGGRETGQGHYPAMVALHAALLVGAVLEVGLLHRPFHPVLGWTMVAVLVAAQAVRWWCIGTLGSHWNTRIVVVPGDAPVRSGPYRWLRHPNYAVVAVEGAALPLVHTAWLTAVAFTVLDAWLLTVRIRAENAALATLAPAVPA